MMPQTKAKWTEKRLVEFIENTYGQDKGWLVLDQVRSGISSWHIRTADALAYGMWPSKGQLIMGFEIKVSYGDWQRELQVPEKADEIAKYCDKWWVVAPKDLIPVQELPEKWGLLEPARTKLHVKKQAVDLETGYKDLPREFISCIFRRFVEKVKKPAREDLRNEYNRGIQEGLDRAVYQEMDKEMKQISYQYKQLKEAVAKFEETSGVQLTGDYGWMGGMTAENVAWLVKNASNLKSRLPKVVKDVTKMAEELEEARKRLKLLKTDGNSRWF
jgi:hypothetical protein